METRSKRREASQRPPYPQISTSLQTTASASSNASSAFQSSSSLASLRSPASATGSSMMAQHAYAYSSAPLPSPMTQQPQNYFGSMALSEQQKVQLQQQAALQQPRNASNSQQQSYMGQRGAAGGMPETAPYLNDLNLVAEAAKRAQMACLMRDLGDVEL